MEAGSTLAGWQIMDFWNRSTVYRIASKKRSMKLRLLHGVVFSEPWFGLWGYKIGYQTLSDHSLVTLGNLSRFMLDLETHLPAENCIDSYNMEPTCRQDVGDAARVHIDDTGLLDLELKSLGNHVVGNYLVRRCLNPVTKLALRVLIGR
ncbi:hypothetical protein NC653_021283 [Populus alba x Populus x berolinensis]|uniref:PTC1-like winged helix-turn-helix domain-containing protein n=1 Tax=Populus alba x Populus x berolinensis TaxID=444605 RepID=A0AAD6MMW0_9ROSI|nr:hypothetical protein NC653_021283 [Populus alba x Populus x berolinensis]